MELNNVPVIHVNKHPILLDHDTQVALEAYPGETLYAFLQRNVQDVDKLEVSIDGRIIDALEWHRVTVRNGQEIVVRSTLHRTALYIVAMVALLYFTGGASAAVMSGGSFGGIVSAGAIAGMSTAASMAAIGAVQIVGAMLINKVLGPKVPKPSNVERGSVFNISSARNGARQWEPVAILFGSVRVTPDYVAKPFNYYRGNDQYVQMLLSPGINVGRYHDLYLGDTLLSTFDSQAVVKRSGFSQMSSDTLTSTTNVDVIAGGTLEALQPVTRTTPAGTTRVQIDLSYLLFDLTSKGKKKENQETVVVRAKKLGDAAFHVLGTIGIKNKEQTEQRRSYYYDVDEGVYDIQVERLGYDTDGSGATCEFTLVSLTAYQVEQNNFDGVSVIQIDIKATGQLNGSPDEIRGVMDAAPLPLWNGTQWVIVDQPGYAGTSNPGAQALQYVRGFRDDNGKLIAGMGLVDDMIDVEAFKALMVHCIENKIEYNMWVQDERNHREFLEGILYPAFGRVTMAPGRVTPIWAREEQATSGVVNMGTIKRGEFQVNYTLVSAADGIELTYTSRTDWQPKTLRVPQPGITVDEMLNPATIGAEGVLDEEQAAMIARYHLGQTLYQAKDITYSTNMMFLGYQEMDLLDLQHDLTQWGFGGRLVDIQNNAGVISVTLDDVVPGRDLSNAWIGLVVPGESGYRVFQVQPFAGNSDTLTLAQPWPADMEFPANVGTKAIHDTIWIYDFKQTPGKRVRVVGMTPDDEFNGASVSVVPEDAAFWEFVRTGAYAPPNNDSLLNAKPIASALSITENVVEQGDTVFTELQALWSITNTSVRNVVTCARDGEDPKVVAETTGLSATWRIESEGLYVITVHPYAESGTPGVAVTIAYDTRKTNLPPVNVDTFNVASIGAGIRKYTWGFNPTTIQSPDMAGVEIRYVTGTVADPVWDSMTPVGNDGFHTVAFESAIPDAGTWTFTIRTRNTSGVLSDTARVITKLLDDSIVEVVDKTIAEQVAQQAKVDAAVAAALEADLKAGKALVLMGDEYDPASTYLLNDVVFIDGRMYRAKANVPMGTPPPNVTYWQDVGTITQAQSGTSSALSQLRVDVDEQGNEFAAAITQVSRQVDIRPNLLPNGGFERGKVNWTHPNAVAGISASWGAELVLSGSFAANDSVISDLLPVDVGVRYTASFDSAMVATSGNTSIGAVYFDGSGTLIGTNTGPLKSMVPYVYTDDIADRERWALSFTPPAGTVYVRIYLNWGSAVGLTYLSFRRVKLERGDSATLYTPDTAIQQTATATIAMKVAQDAQITHVLDVNGNISGTVSKNDGVRSSYSILASVFRVISALGSMGMEWQNGYLRIWKAGAQLVLGHTFGSGDLVFWYGPNIGAGACTKANGTIWFDTGGGAYFGGTLSAGVRKNGAQSTQVSNAASVETGLFNTAGGQKVVTASVGYNNAFTTSSNLGTADKPLSGVLVLERSLNGGAWTELQRITVNGTRVYGGYEAGIGYNYVYSVGGSFNYTDNTTGTPTFNYRARVSSAAGWPENRPEGGFAGTQTTSILSVEQ